MLTGRTAAAFLALLVGGQALAAPVTLGDLTFSDEEGGLVLHDGWGTGTDDDPFTLVEDITEDGPAILVIRGMRRSFGNRVGTDHAIGFVLTKIVRNLTSRPWHSLELELREQKSRPSPYVDGLSFGQALGDRRRFGSDRFDQLSQTDEPLDAVVFSGTTIQPGETVQVRVLVTDYSPTWQFYVLQRRDAPLAGYAPNERVEASR